MRRPVALLVLALPLSAVAIVVADLEPVARASGVAHEAPRAVRSVPRVVLAPVMRSLAPTSCVEVPRGEPIAVVTSTQGSATTEATVDLAELGGRVSTSSGVSLAVTLTARNSLTHVATITTSDATGRFAFRLEPGVYDVSARAERGLGVAGICVSLPSVGAWVDLREAPHGTLRCTPTSPARAVEVTDAFGGVARLERGVNGTFTITVPAGTYWVSATPDPAAADDPVVVWESTFGRGANEQATVAPGAVVEVSVIPRVVLEAQYDINHSD